MKKRRVLVIGGSTRAAADSVRRAGWEPVCADLFADLDLRAQAEVVPVRSYPESLADDVSQVRADAWFYCGALENHPEIIERILATNSSIGPLLGTTPAALKLVRNPHWIANTLKWEGFDVLEVASEDAVPPADSTWIQKPIRSAGGRQVRVWDEAAGSSPIEEPCYFQKRAAGTSMSALFRVDAGIVDWLGASLELPFPPKSNAPSAYAYCGSVGPCSVAQSNVVSTDSWELVTAATQATLIRIAAVLTRQAKGLRGIIGLDFRLSGGRVWLTEVNPRYTASVEVLELATGRSLLNPLADEGIEEPTSDHRHRVVVKQILYATARWTAPDLNHWLGEGDPWEIPAIADIPVPGVVIEPGWPVCSVLATGENRTVAESMLNRRLCLFQSLFSFD